MSYGNTTPLPGTYVTSLPEEEDHRITNYVYYQNVDGLLSKIDEHGKAKVVEVQKKLKIDSPLSAAQYAYPGPPTKPAPVPHVFGKNNDSDIILVTSLEPHDLYINTAHGTGFAALEHDGANIFIHFQRDPNTNEIVERKIRHQGDGHVVAVNAAESQPLAAVAAKEGFRSKYAVDKLVAKDPTAASLPAIGHTRYTVYHGNDGYLWLAYTWDTPRGPFSVSEKVESVSPDDIYNNKGSASPLAIVQNKARLVIYYLNAQGSIYRISLLHEQGWGKPTPVGENLKPRLGTNLSASVRLIGDKLHHHFLVAYQDGDDNIKTVVDQIVFNQP